ncbi:MULTISPECIES: hypothetical protein [Bartonella]|uniref:Uncharacterized protein n=1 Tax=Bartonella chomelii TaxID=236402 RepID=A0ABR6E2B6_9HYPH|nr:MULTISPECIES: hypothetical protein [Bartonella]MBA9082706.1 hypothetical protein [Bartonella chomelii]
MAWGIGKLFDEKRLGFEGMDVGWRLRVMIGYGEMFRKSVERRRKADCVGGEKVEGVGRLGCAGGGGGCLKVCQGGKAGEVEV